MRHEESARQRWLHVTLGAVLTTLALILPGSRAAAQILNVSKNGNTIVASITAPSLTGTQCCLALSLDSPIGPGSCTQPCPHAGWSDSWSCNSVGTHSVSGCWLSSETNYQYACTTQSIEILQSEAAQPGPSCPLFDLLAGSKVLTHLYDANDTYPPGQVQDGQMTVTLKARRANPGTTIYLQVSDPADTSPYGGPHSAGDNVDTTTPDVGTIGGNTQVTTTLPASGQTSTLLLTTSTYAAGDNYEIRGSTDPQFLTDPSFQCTDCPDTGVITVWKRVYLEQDKMFRHGAMLTDVAPAGATEIFVADTSGFVAPKGKKPGSSVVLVHAPPGPGGPIYFEPAAGDPPLTVVKVNAKKGSITLSRPLVHSYSITPDPSKPWLSDGIGIVTGVSSADFYVPNAGFLVQLFPKAFVEVVPPLGSSDPGYVPFYANYTAANLSDYTQSGLRWFRGFGQPNRICAIGGAKSATNLGDRVPAARVAWTWVSQVESLVSSGNQLALNGESTAHELTHVWDVNQAFNNSGHCTDTYSYQNASLLCLMRGGNDWYASGTLKPEFYDGNVAYHYDLLALDFSEFIDIRSHVEPLQ